MFASLDVPNVTVANAWVSPLVKIADPWVEGKYATSHQIGLMLVVFLPSSLITSLKTNSLMASFSTLEKYFLMRFSFYSKSSSLKDSSSCSLTSENCSDLSFLDNPFLAIS